jgi:GGDEF domain-containing protein
MALLGPPGAGQVGLAAALPPAQVTYIDHPRRLGALLHAGFMDVLLLTDPALLGATLDAIERADREPPVMLAAHAGPPFALELPPQVDLLSLPAPTPAIRRRLDLALRLAALRRWLRDPPLGAARALLIDSLTGLYNQGAFLDYLRHTEGDRVVIGLEYDQLEWTNQRDGYAAGNRILARLGGSLRRKVRAQDLAAHLGGGRLAVAVSAAGQAKIDRLRSRLQATIAGAEPWTIIACAEPRPANGPPAQRLARLFGDLGRLRRAA